LINVIFSFLISYLCGSLMFSYWLGKIKGKDIRKVRDGNPGAYNLFKVAGWFSGFIGGFLDFSKGFIPIFFIRNSEGIGNIGIALSAVFAVLGHAFSPFLNFRGGKAISVSFGCWTALTYWEAPLILGAALSLLSIKRFSGKEPSPEEDSFKVLIAFSFLGPYSLIRGRFLVVFWLLNYFLIIYKHKLELKKYFKIERSLKWL